MLEAVLCTWGLCLLISMVMGWPITPIVLLGNGIISVLVYLFVEAKR